ncbi:MAG: cupin domain-containing protein [Bacteroidales bacterium]|nr:cupin domain-containing protein [Bacteroidales bacterium]MCF6341801.1 cupin domain-containing protein [Bacteroidales bacterium]
MKITKVADTPVNDNPHKVDARMLYNKDSAQAVHLQLNPGDSLKPHITPVDVFFFVIEGTPDVLVGEEKMQVETNSLVESPKGIVHCIYNNSDAIVRVLVVKAPRPTTAAKIL